MAEAIFNKIAPENWKSVSCGVIAGPPDGFTFAVMEEKGISLDLNRQPKLFADFNAGESIMLSLYQLKLNIISINGAN